jgi:hypothetical protein
MLRQPAEPVRRPVQLRRHRLAWSYRSGYNKLSACAAVAELADASA